MVRTVCARLKSYKETVAQLRGEVLLLRTEDDDPQIKGFNAGVGRRNVYSSATLYSYTHRRCSPVPTTVRCMHSYRRWIVRVQR